LHIVAYFPNFLGVKRV